MPIKSDGALKQYIEGNKLFKLGPFNAVKDIVNASSLLAKTTQASADLLAKTTQDSANLLAKTTQDSAEQLRKSNEISVKLMQRLTLMLVLVGLIQIIIAVISLFI